METGGMPKRARGFRRVVSGLFLFAFLQISIPCFADSIPIAAILPLTGKAAQTYGEPALAGILVAVEEVNENGGVNGRPLALTVIDNRSTPLHSRSAAQKAIAEGVLGVIGALWSTHSLAAAPLLQEAGIPMISPLSTAPEVTRVGNFIFRSCFTDAFQGRLMAEFAFQDLGARRAAILTNVSETYSQTLARFFRLSFESLGGNVVSEGGYKGSAVDFREILEEARALSPEAVFIPGYDRDSGLVVRQAVSMGIEAVFLGGDAWTAEVARFAGEALEGSYFSTHWHPEAPYARSTRFQRRFAAAHGGRTAGPIAALAYDAVLLLWDAMGRARSLDGDGIRDALAATEGFSGASGIFRFDENGDPPGKGASILRYRNRKWGFYKAFIP